MEKMDGWMAAWQLASASPNGGVRAERSAWPHVRRPLRRDDHDHPSWYCLLAMRRPAAPLLHGKAWQLLEITPMYL